MTLHLRAKQEDIVAKAGVSINPRDLHKALTSTSLHTSEMNWNEDCTPGFLISEPDLANAPVAPNPQNHAPNSSGKSGGYYNSKGGLNLEWYIQQVYIWV